MSILKVGRDESDTELGPGGLDTPVDGSGIGNRKSDVRNGRTKGRGGDDGHHGDTYRVHRLPIGDVLLSVGVTGRVSRVLVSPVIKKVVERGRGGDVPGGGPFTNE